MCYETSIAQNPTYSLNVNDGNLVAPNIFEFDIDMTWTNSGNVPNFEYAGGQYFFNIDICNQEWGHAFIYSDNL
jgi:hypothetical protein